MSQSHEIELKFLCAPDDLSRVLAAAPAGDDECRELISVYFDTPDLALQRAGASLRVRESKGQRVQTLKRGDGLAREEHETPIEGAAPDPRLGPLPELLPQGVDAELKPAFNVCVTRRQRLIRYDGAEIELAVDQGEVRGGKLVSPISEVELELKSGEPAALFGLARELGRSAPLYLSFESKSARGQALVAGQGPKVRRRDKVELARGATVGEAFRAIARPALGQIAGNAEVLRERADAEAVHQLRVAARTLRSALTTFRRAVADKDVERVKAELRWLARACDAARNLDVFAEETLAAAAGHPPPGLGALQTAVEMAREAARRVVCEAVSSERYRNALIDLTAWVETGDWLQGDAAGEPVRRVARRALEKRRKRLLADGRDLVQQSDEVRHQVRIEAKKLRYAAEGFQSLFPGRGAGRFIGRLKDLQEALGGLNDAATAAPLMMSLPLSPEAAFAAGQLVGRKACHKDAHIAAAAEALERLAGVEPFWR